MENITLHELIGAVKGEFLSGNPHSTVNSISIDSRSIKKGEYFFALSGDNYDGHDFLMQVIEKRAGGIIVSCENIDIGSPFPSFPAIVRVADTVKALGDLAQFVRNKSNVETVGITGSNGKTTTKEILAAILEQKAPTLKNDGNFNNHIGLPLTLLKLEDRYKYAVLEMGTSSYGEIKRLAEISQPTIGIITNIGAAHLESFKSLEGVFEEKRELFDVLPPEGFAVINGDDPFLSGLLTSGNNNFVTFGIENASQVLAKNIKLHPGNPIFDLCIESESVQVRMPVLGKVNIYNALAASAAAWKLGFDLNLIKGGIESFKPAGMRMEIRQLSSGITVINDAYNANPSSLRQSIYDLVSSFPERKKIVVLGDMLELGDTAEEEHSKIGEFLALQPLAAILLYGHNMKDAYIKLNSPIAMHFNNEDSLEDELKSRILKGSVVFFKASRGMMLEKVIHNIFTEY